MVRTHAPTRDQARQTVDHPRVRRTVARNQSLRQPRPQCPKHAQTAILCRLTITVMKFKTIRTLFVIHG